MSERFLIWFFLFWVFQSFQPVHAAEFMVTRTTDTTFEEGELRVILQHACDVLGDDTIRFAHTRLREIRIHLKTPLVIPADCQGSVIMIGSDEVDILLDATLLSGGGSLPGDNCTLHIYSDRHTVRNISFVNHANGAGVCLFGRDNRIEGNRFGHGLSGLAESNQYGLVISDAFFEKHPEMTGGQNQIIANHIRSSTRNGIWGDARGTLIQDNEITQSGESGIVLYDENHEIHGNHIFANHRHGIHLEGGLMTIAANEIEDNDGVGVLIAGKSSRLTLGGPSFEADGNRIQRNQRGGVVIVEREADGRSEGHTITHNILSRNLGTPANLDLNNDGVTGNDFGDKDMGPNRLLNFAHHFQAFPLVRSRYWGWGLDLHGTRLELYGVALEDLDLRRTHGGGDSFLADATIEDWNFEIVPGLLKTGHWTTALTFDEGGNTSEFSLNLPVHLDEDLDGIIDNFERGDGTSASGRSSSSEADSDHDGLPDPVEDRNRNGVWEQNLGETSAYNADSDGDLLSDWAEVHGDGIYDEGIDTNPLNPDTDGDGLLDGVEDYNGNGLWEGYLGESSPLLIDSDADGFSDGVDTCPVIFNPGQERWYCE